MGIKWEVGDQVIVTKQGLDQEGVVNLIDKKSGLIHVHTDRGPVTLLANSSAIKRLEPEVPEKPSKSK